MSVIVLAGTASAQPAPEPTPPAEGEPAQVEPAPPAEPPAAVAPAGDDKPAVEVKYDKGLKLASADESFGLSLNLRTQVRFESSRSLADGSEFESQFLIPRSRLSINGNAWGDEIGYKVEFAVADRGFSALKDVYADKKLGSAWVRIGQWKRPFIRQWITPAFAMQFNERALTSGFGGNGRDLGVALHNNYEKSPEGAEWVIGVFNGFSGAGESPKIRTTCMEDPMTMEIVCTTPTPTNLPGDFGPAIVTRVAWNVGKIKGYNEGDPDGGAFRLSVGASYKVDLANLDSPIGDNLSHGVELDTIVKAQGFAFTFAGYLMKLQTAEVGIGGHAQTGYYVVPKKVELAGRFAIVPDGNRYEYEARAAFNYMWRGHNLKLATDIGFVETTGTDPATMESYKPELQFRTMFQTIL